MSAKRYAAYGLVVSSVRPLPFVEAVGAGEDAASALVLCDGLVEGVSAPGEEAWALVHEAPDYEGGPSLRVYWSALATSILIDYAGWRVRWALSSPLKVLCEEGEAIAVGYGALVERVVMPLWCLTCLPDVLALHGSAVWMGDRAAVFLGDSGAGKSTTAYEIAARGQGRLIADDMVLVDVARGVVLPGAPTVRLWRAKLDHAVESEAVSPAMDKRWFRLPDAWATLAPLALGPVVVLRRASAAPVQGACSRVGGVEALSQVLGQCFDLDSPWPAWAKRRMRLAAALVRSLGELGEFSFAGDEGGEPAHVVGLIEALQDA